MTYQWQSAGFTQLSQRQLYALLQLRQRVFVVEQTCIYLDLDDRDQQAVHMLCWQDDELQAYLRCLAPGASYPDSSLGRIVVSPRARGRHLGKDLVKRGICHNLQQWPQSDIRINAQAYLTDFYTELGFAAQGQEYDEDGIAHIQMVYRRSAALE